MPAPAVSAPAVSAMLCALAFASAFASVFPTVSANPPNMCNEFNCRYLYSASNVRIDSCKCNDSSHSFAYPPGYNYAKVNYNLSYPVAQDFYQNHKLIGQCPPGLWCNVLIPLEPSLRLITTITEFIPIINKHDDDDDFEMSLHI